MPITSETMNPPASLRSDPDRHRSESLIGFSGIRKKEDQELDHAELALAIAEIGAALEENPPDWKLAIDRWFDLSAACKGTSLEYPVDWLAGPIRMQDVVQTRTLIERLRTRLAAQI